jgi:hypothetical protein
VRSREHGSQAKNDWSKIGNFDEFNRWYRKGLQKVTCVSTLAMAVDLQGTKTRKYYWFIWWREKGRGRATFKCRFIDVQIGQGR